MVCPLTETDRNQRKLQKQAIFPNVVSFVSNFGVTNDCFGMQIISFLMRLTNTFASSRSLQYFNDDIHESLMSDRMTFE